MKILKSLILILFPFCIFAKCPFLIYYGDNASFSYLNQFKVIVLDPDNYNYVYGLKPFKYGYLSIGEVENFREYFKYVKKMGVLKQESNIWKGSYYVDLSSKKWQKFVIKFIIPSIISKGYDGIFLDTTDSLLKINKEKDVIDFINSLKKNFPKIKFMINRGFKILNKVNVDAALFESTITSYNFKTKKYYFLKETVKVKIPYSIEKYSIDYWYLNDFNTIKEIYKKAIKLGYKPFVSEISLHKLPEILYDEDFKKFIIVDFSN